MDKETRFGLLNCKTDKIGAWKDDGSDKVNGCSYGLHLWVQHYSKTSNMSSTSCFLSNPAAVKWISSACKLEVISFSSDRSRFYAILMQAVGDKDGQRSSRTSLDTGGKV